MATRGAATYEARVSELAYDSDEQAAHANVPGKNLLTSLPPRLNLVPLSYLERRESDVLLSGRLEAGKQTVAEPTFGARKVMSLVSPGN